MEFIDLYKDQFVKTEQTVIRKTTIPEDHYGLIVFGCIFDHEGKILIQQRAKNKSWAGIWDVSSGGAVISGETSREAVVRETREELGIDLDPDRFVKVCSLYYDNSIHDIYNVVLEEGEHWNFNVPNEEVAAVKWASEEEIMDMLDDGTFLPVYKEFIGLLFRMKTRKGIVTY